MFTRIVGVLFVSLVLISCTSQIDDLIELVETINVERKPLDLSLLGINAFVNDSQYGTPTQQFREIRDTLKIKYVRVLISWNDLVQPTPSSPIDWNFNDYIIGSLQDGVEALVIITDAPTWMKTPSNWTTQSNPRLTTVDRFIVPVLKRYGNNPHITSFQIWNEPNNPSIDSNSTIDVLTSASNYVELLAASEPHIRQYAPNRLIVSTATTALNQNYPNSLEYNKAMNESGIQNVCDIFAIHYYGKSFENIVRKNGIAEFLSTINKPVWVTEIGIQGLNNQLDYAERAVPYLKEKIPQIERFFIYTFTDLQAPPNNFGLRANQEVSDLYIHLRDR